MAAAERKIIQRRIAAVNNLPPVAVKENELRTLYRLSYGIGVNEASLALQRKYVGNVPERGQVERTQQLFQLIENHLDAEPITNSYGLYAPSYLAALQEQQAAVEEQQRWQGRRAEIDAESPGHTALLVGALTPDAINEYASTIRKVHPDASCYVSDIAGHDTRKTSNARFVYGDALHLPFNDVSFDSLHTNVLLDPYSDDINEHSKSRNEFFSEAWRVLRPGGRLIMVEESDHNAIVLGDLRNTGFSRVTAEHATEFISRRSMERFLGILPGHSDPRGYVGEIDPSDKNLIVATK